MKAPSLEFWATVEKLVRDLKPEDCDSMEDYYYALEFHALPVGIDLWSQVFLTPDGEVIWAGWIPLEVKRSRDKNYLNAAIHMAAERFPAMATFIRPPC